jgi:hypothetical protein
MTTFKITKDHISDTTPASVEKNQSNENEIKKDFPYKFRLYDGDGELYFEGFSIDNSSFDPQDHFSESYGVTTIKYFENGEWVEL